VHALPTHAAVPWATLVEHLWPHVPQLFASPAVSTHVPPQTAGAAVGHPDAQPYESPEPAHTGVLPLHALPQLPQLVPLVSWMQAPLHGT
jgi:hypothetical protein